MKFLQVILVFLISPSGFSQVSTDFPGGPINAQNGIIDGPYLKEHIPTKRMIPYEPVREADVLWSKRVWRAIDLREKINHPLYYPLDEVTPYGWNRNNDRWSLWTIMRFHILRGDLQVFSPYNPASFGLGEFDGDQLKYPIDHVPGGDFYTDSSYREDLLYYLGHLGPQSEIYLTDEFGDPLIKTEVDGTQSYVYPPRDTMWYESKDIVEYHIKEDWFFDKERSVLDVRIIAIAPVVYDIDYDVNGSPVVTRKRELFWLYFPHLRYVLNNYFAYNDQNDTQWMSYDDLFWKRRFSSYIYKESNVYDRPIDSYTNGIDALYESENITNEIRNLEHDLWSY